MIDINIVRQFRHDIYDCFPKANSKSDHSPEKVHGVQGQVPLRSGGALESLLLDVTDFELLQARDDLRTWLMRWENGKHYQDRLPADYPHWDLNVQEIFRSLPTTGQAIVLAGWLALRKRSYLPVG